MAISENLLHPHLPRFNQPKEDMPKPKVERIPRVIDHLKAQRIFEDQKRLQSDFHGSTYSSIRLHADLPQSAPNTDKKDQSI